MIRIIKIYFIHLGEPGTGFRAPDDCWMHIDQCGKRRGLHAYQGAVYMEETTEKDYCFRVIDGSHEYHSEFYAAFPKAADRSNKSDFYKLTADERMWYENNGCHMVYVPVPKGGIVLWDSRTVHDNITPLMGRPNTDRWRCVCFVSMTPAIWAEREDIEFKNKAYADIAMTTHWSSHGQARVKSDSEHKDILFIRRLPQTARTKEAKLIMGIDLYNFNDGEANGPPKPTWK